MKKIILTLIALFVALPFVWAVPADPTPYKYVQPDGSVIILQNHGDEFFHWKTDASGRVVQKGADGFYRPVEINLASEVAKASNRRNEMNKAWSSFENPPVTNFGDRKVLCILANFTDISYTVADPNTHFANMLNQNGYSLNGAIGSVRDYYIDNSGNQYRPQFDVYGPVPLSHNSSYYDTNGVAEAIMEAYSQLSGEINIADYDTDNDGAIDMVLFYFPGHNEAEGGPEETIWPHQATGYFGDLGTKRLVRYFCTSELSGDSGDTPASIGTTCHEFAHSLGLPDFYDVDYAGSGGENTTTGPYDLMAFGNYNDNGRKPPYLSAVERNMLGWMPAPTGIAASGDYTLEPVQNNKAYKIDTSVPGEYFVLESRNGYKWDSSLPSGLLLYHIDKSDRIVDTEHGFSAAYLWENTNSINDFFGHPCYYLVPTSGSASNWNQYIFPGTDNVSSYILTDWMGNAAGVSLTGIAHNGTESSFSVLLSNHRQVFGVVRDTDGNPLQNVQVSLTPSTGAFSPAPSFLSGSVFCMTDADGQFVLELDDAATVNQILLAQKDGFTPLSYNLTISSLFTNRDITLLRKGEGAPVDLYKYDNSGGMLYWSLGVDNVAVAMRFTSAELEARNAVGALLKTVTFFAGADQGETVYVVVDIEGETTLRREVTAQYTPSSFVTIDISDAGIIIPNGKDIYIGYGLENITTNYPIPAYGDFAVDHGGLYVCTDFMSSHIWSGFSYSGMYYDAIVSATLSTTAEIEFSTLGVSYIKVTAGVPTVVIAAGKSHKSTKWYLDGVEEATPTAIASLTTGTHTYKAVIQYYDGTSERVFYDVVAP